MTTQAQDRYHLRTQHDRRQDREGAGVAPRRDGGGPCRPQKDDRRAENRCRREATESRKRRPHGIGSLRRTSRFPKRGGPQKVGAAVEEFLDKVG